MIIKLLSGIWQRLHPPVFATEYENRKAKILSLLIVACFTGVFMVLLTRIFGGPGISSNLVAPLSLCLFLIFLSQLFLFAKRLAIASYLLLFSLFGLIAYLIVISGNGYNDSSVFAVPGILIIAGILLEKKQFYLFTGVTLLLIVILVGLENLGFYQTKYSDLISPYAGIDIILIIAVTSVSVHILADDLFKSLEQAKESEMRFRELAEMLPETIYEVDMQGELTFVNEKSFDLFGYTRQEFNEGINVIEFIHEDDRIRAIDNMGKVAAGEDIGIKEYNVQRKDGTIFPGLFHSSPITRNNEVVGFRGFLIDITEKKRTQEFLIQSEKMMSIGGLAAGMAHEINNPLAGIIQNANVLSNRLIDKKMPANIAVAKSLKINIDTIQQYMDKREIPKMLKAITESGSRVASIVNNMLSFVRRSDSNFSTHDPAFLLDQILEIACTDFDLKKNYDFKNIVINKEYEKNLPNIVCDEGQIQQVLLNILNNGALAMHENPHKVTPEFVLRLKNETYSNMLCIEIEDNGPGIDEDTLKRIFEPFFTTKSVGQGTGLGLSVSYFIVTENHKGTIQVQSELGKGTNFIIRLPLEQK